MTSMILPILHWRILKIDAGTSTTFIVNWNVKESPLSHFLWLFCFVEKSAVSHGFFCFDISCLDDVCVLLMISLRDRGHAFLVMILTLNIFPCVLGALKFHVYLNQLSSIFILIFLLY